MQAERIAGGVHRARTLMVNVYFVRDRTSGDWAVIDTGMPGYAGAIRRLAQKLFGTRPRAIFLTHGHFDHVGGLPALADEWRVPVYAHELELPYLTGASPYPHGFQSAIDNKSAIRSPRSAIRRSSLHLRLSHLLNPRFDVAGRPRA